MKKWKNKSKKQKVGSLAAASAVLLVVAGTFAFTSYTEWVRNHMQSAGYEKGAVNIVEVFPPGQELDANATIQKKVDVQNASGNDVIVRVSFEEMLSKLTSGETTAGNAAYTPSKTAFPVIVNPDSHASGWTEVTGPVTILDGNGTSTAKPANLKLFVNGNSTMLVNQTSGLKYYADKPADSNVELPKAFQTSGPEYTIPTINGTKWADATGATVEQKVTAKATLKDGAGATGTYELSDVKYFTYASTYTDTANDWKNPVVNLNSTNYPGFTGTVGTMTPAAGSAKVSSVNSDITFDMPNVVTTIPSSGQGKWFYSDGYFYYDKVLADGTKTESSVLENINIGAADTTWKLSSYDLWVGLDSIPASKAALDIAFDGSQIGSGSSGWRNMSSQAKAYFTALPGMAE